MNSADSCADREKATRLFLDIIRGVVQHDEKIVVKVLEVFGITLANIETGIDQLEMENGFKFGSAKILIEQYIMALLNSESYFAAVSLLEHFSIRESGDTFLQQLIHNQQYKAAEKWATFMGKPMLRILVKAYADSNMLKHAYDTIEKNNLRQEFPDVYQKCKER